MRLAGTKSERLDLVYARVPLMHLRGDTFPTTRTLPPHPLQRLGQRLAAEALRLLLRKLADGEVCLLLAGARFTEGYALDLHHCLMETWSLRPASHLARSLLRHCIDKENLPPKILKILRRRDPLLLIRMPPVSTPATNRARTLRKRMSSIETGIAAVRQA